MKKYILRRLIYGALSAFLVSIIIFVIMRIAPGDVAAMIAASENEEGASPEATQERIDAIREEIGLNRPLVVQYYTWQGSWLIGDWGNSLYNSRSVWGEFKRKVPVSIELALFSLLLSTALGIPAGIIMATKQDKWPDYWVRMASLAGLSVPNFWIGTMLIVGGVYLFEWSPRLQYHSIFDDPFGNLSMLFWPSIVLGVSGMAGTARMMRSTMLEVLRQDYIRTAHAKGLKQVVILYRHAVKNALLPVVTQIGITFATLIGGSVIIERVFALPGVGNLLVEGMSYRDYTVVQSLVLMFAIWVVLSNLITDLVYGWLDPRISYS